MILFALLNIYGVKPPEILWDKVYDSGNNDWAFGITADNSGNVYVTGASNNGKDYDCLILKYDSLGNILWQKRYDKNDDYGRDIVADTFGYLYVTGPSGISPKYDFLTIKYDQEGNLMWEKFYDSGDDDKALGITKDGRGNIYVTGSFYDGRVYGQRTLKYDSTGEIKLEMVYSTPNKNNFPYGVRVDKDGYIYVAGSSGLEPAYDYRLIKYDSTGNIQWNKVYDSGELDWVNGIDIDTQGFIYITGTSGKEALYDFLTLKYNSLGDTVWAGVYDSGNNDAGMDVAVDEAGYVYVLGYSFNSAGDWTDDYQIVKYDPMGNIVWNVVYNSGDMDEASEICLDNRGYIYITGASLNGKDYNYLTIKYRQFFSIKGYIKDSEGNGIEGVIVHLTGALKKEDTTEITGYYEFLDLPCAERYVVRPEKEGYTFIPPERVYDPLNSDKRGESFICYPLGLKNIEKRGQGFSIQTLSRKVFNIRYKVPTPSNVEIKIYSISGEVVATLVNERKGEGRYEVKWQAGSSGIYFIKFTIGKGYLIKKIVVIK